MRANPRFNNPQQAAYELPDLLSILGQPDVLAPLTQDQRDCASAIHSHARNAQEFIHGGIEAIGYLMSSLESDADVCGDQVFKLGMLLRHLACEADRLRVLQSDMRCTLDSDDELIAKQAPAPTGRTSKTVANAPQ
jgi:hypothetical protein